MHWWPGRIAEQVSAEQLVVEARTHRRTALVALRGELDIVTVSKVAEPPQPRVVRGSEAIHRVLKLTGVEDLLVLVDDPDDLVSPPLTH